MGVIGVVATNAALTKAQASKLASVSHNGISGRCAPPTQFVTATDCVKANPDAVGILAARAVEGAILNAVTNAHTLCGYPSCRGLPLL